MFWKNIADWNSKKVKLYYALFTFLYFIFSLLIPVIIVSCNYDFVKSGTRLSGLGIIVVLVVGIVGFRSLVVLFNRMPHHSYKKRMIKYSCLLVSKLLVLVLAVVLLFIAKDNTITAINTCLWCILSFSIAVVIDYTCLKFLEYEFEIDDEKDKQKEVQARMHRN